ncbi:sigma-54-dependent transcriptional regulator [Alkalilacustris brevis]|uniref:sigma-54-dependent transcriptional regulator n=1 Tax=Alkalilacustris brevis TaxID=2026338 RepID=UPI000E0D48F7|nr:sigma-54 dependent transcriptional regulator [Alkalilacustris brevis]
MNRPSLLVVEDTPSLQKVYQAMLRTGGFPVTCEDTGERGLRSFRQLRPPVVLLDLKLPDGDGLQILSRMLEIQPQTRIIVITADNSIGKAVKAMRAGAYEFLVKPVDECRLLGAVRNALASASSPAMGEYGESASADKIIGSSPVMREVHDRIAAAARSMATVFITGESGTGKELFAMAVHHASGRAQGPFVPLSCGAIPLELLESEMFGHLKGAFSGALSDKLGAAAAAQGGTLFLDEICEMDPSLQVKMLRFLQTAMIQPVGAIRSRKVDVRIICATSRDPFEAMRQGRLREDLYYRLHVLPVHMPPLRARGDDVIEIAETMLRKMSEEEGRAFTGLAPEVAGLFQRLPWPGNVRQLLNVLRHVVVMHDGPLVTLAMLPAGLHRLDEPTATGPAAGPGLDGLVGKPLAEIERLVIEETIAREGGSVPRAARVLDVSPSTLYRKREAWQQQDDE